MNNDSSSFPPDSTREKSVIARPETSESPAFREVTAQLFQTADQPDPHPSKEFPDRSLLPPLCSGAAVSDVSFAPPSKRGWISGPVKITFIKAVSLPVLDISRFTAEPKGDQKLIGQFIALARGGQLTAVKPVTLISIHPEYFARLAMAEVAHGLTDAQKTQLGSQQKAALQHGQRYLDNPGKYAK